MVSRHRIFQRSNHQSQRPHLRSQADQLKMMELDSREHYMRSVKTKKRRKLRQRKARLRLLRLKNLLAVYSDN